MEIPASVYEQMIGHVRQAAPLEGCGLLAAGPDGAVTHAYCMGNLDASETSYTLDPSEHIAALHDAESRGWHLAAVFHSHPGGAPVPSRADVAGALEPDWAHVIIGLGDEVPAVRGYRIVDGMVSEVPIVVEGA